MGEEEKEIEKSNEIIDIVEKILEFNKQNQEEQRLKILTPDQMLSRLPISLAIYFFGNYCSLCTIQKNFKNNSIKVWLTLFKNGNNLYEH